VAALLRRRQETPEVFREPEKSGQEYPAPKCAVRRPAPKHFLDRKADLLARLRRTLQLRLAHSRADKFIRKLASKRNQLVACLDFQRSARTITSPNACSATMSLCAKSPSVTVPSTATVNAITRCSPVSFNRTHAEPQSLAFLHQLLASPAAAAAASARPLFRALNYYELSRISHDAAAIIFQL